MDKKFFLGLFTGCALMFLSFSLYFPQISEAIYSIPPTDAFAGFRINDNATYTLSADQGLNASSYKDIPWLLSDGSINIEIGVAP